MSGLAARDDGVAGVVAFVLLLALAVTYYAHVATHDVPRWGAELEAEWDDQLGESLTRLTRASQTSLGTDAPVSAVIPQPPAPHAFEIPLVGRTEPLRPGGSLAFEPRCVSFTAIHTTAGGDIVDLAAGAPGCLHARVASTYSPSFGYRAEFGGLLRLQEGRSLVMLGPPLALGKVGEDEVRVSLTLVGFDGQGTTTSLDHAGGLLQLVPKAHTIEVSEQPNAANATWVLATDHAEAWAAWFEERLAASVLDPALNRVRLCAPGDAAPCPASGSALVVELGGVTADPSVHDIRLSISHGTYSVELG